MNDDDLKGSLTLNKDGESANIPDVPRPILEALYSTLTSAKDEISQIRRLPSIVKTDDVDQLITRLDQWSKPYDPVSRSVRIVAQTVSKEGEQKGRNKIEFHSLEEMRRMLPGTTDEITSLTIFFDFVAMTSELSKELNQCEVSIDLKGAVRRVFYSYSTANPLGGYANSRNANWSAWIKVKYNDVIVARGVLGVIDEWYKNLPQRHFPMIGWFRRFLHRSENYETYDTVNLTFRFLPPLFGGATSLALEGRIRSVFETIPEVPFWFISIGLCSLIYYLFFAISLKRFDRLEGGYLVPLLELSSGDERRLEAFQTKMTKREARLNLWVRTVGVGLIVSLLASVIMIFVRSI